MDNIADETEVVSESNPHKTGFVAYDENLLEITRTQWQFGDWASLMELDRETLQHHPDRAKLALLAAAGHMQQGDIHVALQFTRLAQDWGGGKKLISQILIAGVHNSLGRVSAVNGEYARAKNHFENAILITGSPIGVTQLLTQARMTKQLGQLDTVIMEKLKEIKLDKAAVDSKNGAKQKKKIYFHAGTVKTGSTYLQFMFWKYRELLKNAGVLYFDMTEPKLYLPRYANADFLLDLDRKRGDNDINRALKESEQDVIVISDEGLWSHIEVVGMDCFDDFEKNIVIYVRKPAEVIASWAGEIAKPYNAFTNDNSLNGCVPIEKGIEILTEMYGAIFNEFFEKIEKIKNIDIHFISYGRGGGGRWDVLHHFLSIIKPSALDSDDIKQMIADKGDNITNESKTRKYCDISCIVYDILNERGVRDKYSNDFVDFVYGNCKSGDDRSVIETLSDEAIDKITNSLAFVDNEIAKRQMPWMVEDRFPSCYKKPRLNYAPVDSFEVAGIVDKYLNEL